MSDIEETKGLMATDDPTVWAEEFTRIFKGYTIHEENTMTDRVEDGRNVFGPWLGPDTMITWFANAMQTAIDITKARLARISAATEHIPQADKDAFVKGVYDGREESL